MSESNSTAVFGGGCFWCTEAVFSGLKGVTSVVPGYTGGSVERPAYEQVCQGSTGHAEAVRIEYDQSVITYRDLLEVFFATHDPTTLNRQGNDVGEQYRSAIFYANAAERDAAEAIIKELTDEQAYRKPIVTRVEPLKVFYQAEDYHKRYYETNQNQPYCRFVIAPKLKKFKEKFASLLKE